MTWSGVEPGRRRLTRAEQPPRYLVPECRESIGVIHRDDDILVINKPAFLLSVPGRAPATLISRPSWRCWRNRSGR